MTTHPIPGAVLQHAQRLADALQGTRKLTAERYGHELLVNARHGVGQMAERVSCRPDDAGVLRWWWSWGKPIVSRTDRTRVLAPSDLEELVDAIRHVVELPVPRP